MLRATTRRFLVSSGIRRTTTTTPAFGASSVNLAAVSTVKVRCSMRGFSSTSDNDQSDFFTGNVKFYNKYKYYGFLTPYDQPDLEVFVHRSDLVSNLPADQHPRFPTLRKGERVRFQIDWVQDKTDGTQQAHARQVTFANGKPIPPLRRGFWKNTVQRIQTELGAHVYTIMTDNSDNDDSVAAATGAPEQWERIQGAWKIAETRLVSAKELIERVGMRMEDFDLDDDKSTEGDAKDTEQF